MTEAEIIQAIEQQCGSLAARVTALEDQLRTFVGGKITERPDLAYQEQVARSELKK